MVIILYAFFRLEIVGLVMPLQTLPYSGKVEFAFLF